MEAGGGAGECNSWPQRGCLGSVVPPATSQKPKPKTQQEHRIPRGMEALLREVKGKGCSPRGYRPGTAMQGQGADRCLWSGAEHLKAEPCPGDGRRSQRLTPSEQCPHPWLDASRTRINVGDMDFAFFASSFYGFLWSELNANTRRKRDLREGMGHLKCDTSVSSGRDRHPRNAQQKDRSRRKGRDSELRTPGALCPLTTPPERRSSVGGGPSLLPGACMQLAWEAAAV